MSPTYTNGRVSTAAAGVRGRWKRRARPTKTRAMAPNWRKRLYAGVVRRQTRKTRNKNQNPQAPASRTVEELVGQKANLEGQQATKTPRRSSQKRMNGE